MAKKAAGAVLSSILDRIADTLYFLFCVGYFASAWLDQYLGLTLLRSDGRYFNGKRTN